MDKFELALEELKNNLKLQCEGVDACKDSVKSSLNTSGLIIALIKLLSNNTDYSSLLWIIPFILYGIMLFVYILTINPVTLTAPLKTDKKVFNKYLLLEEDDNKVVNNLIDRYIKVINNNKEEVNNLIRKAKLANWIGFASIAISIISFIVGNIGTIDIEKPLSYITIYMDGFN